MNFHASFFSIEQNGSTKDVIAGKAQQYCKLLSVEGNVLPHPLAGNSKLYDISMSKNHATLKLVKFKAN